MPSQPSPSLAARLTAASERPPTMSGIGGDGGGAISGVLSEKNSPLKLTGLPSPKLRRTCRHSSIRRPRVLGSTPQIWTSWGSSPPIPTPRVSRPGASCRDGGELTGDRNRVAQRQQVEPDVHRQRSLSGEQGGGGDQPVRSRSDEEADVIADAEVVDARLGDAGEHRRSCSRLPVSWPTGGKSPTRTLAIDESLSRTRRPRPLHDEPVSTIAAWFLGPADDERSHDRWHPYQVASGTCSSSSPQATISSAVARLQRQPRAKRRHGSARRSCQ